MAGLSSAGANSSVGEGSAATSGVRSVGGNGADAPHQLEGVDGEGVFRDNLVATRFDRSLQPTHCLADAATLGCGHFVSCLTYLDAERTPPCGNRTANA